jgi:guanylate kinase
VLHDNFWAGSCQQFIAREEKVARDEESNMQARMAREVNRLAEFDRIERQVIDAHLAELEAQLLETALRALDAAWRRTDAA